MIKTATSAVLTHTVLHLRCHGNIPAEEDEEITSLPLTRLHNGMHVHCSLQSPHTKGIGMITSIWNLPCGPFQFHMRNVTHLTHTHTHM